MGFPYTRELVREFIMYAPWRLHPRIPHHILSRMYTCERLGENATEFRYATIDGGHLGSGSGGAWVRAAVAVAGVSLFAQVSNFDSIQQGNVFEFGHPRPLLTAICNYFDCYLLCVHSS